MLDHLDEQTFQNQISKKQDFQSQLLKDSKNNRNLTSQNQKTFDDLED